MQQFNFITKEAYQGENSNALAEAQKVGEYKSPYWMTYLQAKQIGLTVKKGSHGVRIVYFSKTVRITEQNTEKKSAFFKYYTVFNEEQCGLPDAPKNSKENID